MAAADMAVSYCKYCLILSPFFPSGLRVLKLEKEVPHDFHERYRFWPAMAFPNSLSSEEHHCVCASVLKDGKRIQNPQTFNVQPLIIIYSPEKVACLLPKPPETSLSLALTYNWNACWMQPELCKLCSFWLRCLMPRHIVPGCSRALYLQELASQASWRSACRGVQGFEGWAARRCMQSAAQWG